MDLHELAVETAEKQAKAESKAFERALIKQICPRDDLLIKAAETIQRLGSAAQDCKSCDDLRIEQIAAHYGFTSQADMAIEECSELIQAICKLRRGYSENHYTNLLEEIADVYIMARQLRYLLGYSTIDLIVNDKLNRQLKRIEGDAEGRCKNDL